MKVIALVSAVYPPEPLVSGIITHDLAAELCARGSKSVVLAPHPSRPVGAKYPAAESRQVGKPADCPEVIQLDSFTSPGRGFWGRNRESWSFGEAVIRQLRRIEDIDCVYTNAWPMWAQALVANYCSQRGLPFVLHIQDVYPESLTAKLPGPIGSLLEPPLRALDRAVCRKAAKVVVVSEDMRNLFLRTRRAEAQRLETVRNWQDERKFENVPSKAQARRAYGISEDDFVLMYFGNIGPVAGVEILVRAFSIAARRGIRLVIGGDGSEKPDAIRLARELCPNSIDFISEPEAARVPFIQAASDVLLLPMRKRAGITSVPSKLPAYMLSAKPIIAIVDSNHEVARCIADSQCGWTALPGDAESVAARMTQSAMTPASVLEQMGERGRAYGLDHFSRRKGVCALADIVLGVRALG